MVANMIKDQILMIGYGNELRGDDAAGPKVVAAVDAWNLEQVQTLIRHQLTPELAEPIAQARAVIFVDASTEITGDTAQVRALEPAMSVHLMTHGGDPGVLLPIPSPAAGGIPYSRA